MRRARSTRCRIGIADPTKRSVGTLTLDGRDRRLRRSDRRPLNPFGPDRGLSGDARSDAGAGAGPARPDRSGPGALAVRQDRQLGTAVTAGRSRVSTSILAGCSPATRSASTIPTMRPAHAAHAHARAGRRSGRAAAAEYRDADPNDKVVGVDFSGGMASVVSQINAALGDNRAAVLEPVPATRCAILDDGAANKST